MIIKNKKLIPLVVFFISYISMWLVYKNMWILVEARCWIESALEAKNSGTLYEMFYSQLSNLINIGENSRYASYAAVTLFSSICNYNVVCHNSFQILVLALTGALITAFLIKLEVRILIAVIFGFLWFLTEPVLSAIGWQATILDKFAAFYSILGLNIAFYLYEKSSTKSNIFLSNTALLILVILANNSKEAAFSLMPSIVTLYFLLDSYKAKKISFKSYSKLLMPVTYAIYQNYFFMAKQLSLPHAIEHNLSGNIRYNLGAFIGYVFNHDNSEYIILLSLVSIIFIILLLKVALKKFDINFMYLIWGAISFFGTYTIIVQAKHPSPFYVLTSSAYLMILLPIIYINISDIFVTIHKQWIKKIFIVMLNTAFCMLVAWQVFGFYQKYTSIYNPIIRTQGLNITSSIDSIRAILKGEVYSKINIVYPASNAIGYMYIKQGCFYAFAVEQEDKGQIKDMAIQFLDSESYNPNNNLQGNIYIIFDKNMNFISAYNYDKKIK